MASATGIREAALSAALCLLAAACGSNDADSSAGLGGVGGGAGSDSGAGDGARLDGSPCTGPGARYVTGVVAHQFGPGQASGQDRFPEIVFGPPRGGGSSDGSLNTLSLGNGGTVTLVFGNNAIVAGPGPDFIVFENAFESGGGAVFAELATVEVSADGANWVGFSCVATQPPYGSCAGHHPVYANPDKNQIDPLNPAQAGGDAFDLTEVGLEQARFVRITDRADIDGFSGVFDLDAVAIVNAQCP
jgi:hypothetical protein